MIDPLRRLYAGRVSVGDRLGETFYAVWMAVVSIGLLNSSGHITEESIRYAVGVAFSVNIAWGLIDGITVMFTNIIDRANGDRLLYALRSGKDPDAARRARDELDDSIAASLPDAEKDRIVAAIAALPAGADPAARGYWPDRNDLLYAFGIFLIDVGLVIPVVAPLLIIHDAETAVYASRLIATAIFAAVGWAYARHLNGNPAVVALLLGLLGFAVFTHAFEAGW